MKILMFSHDADIDGMGPIVLASYLYNQPGDQIDYELVNYKNIDQKIVSQLENGSLAAYDMVYITDVCPTRDTLELLDREQSLKGKLMLFDHHRSSLGNRDFGWVDIRESMLDGLKRTSATELFYYYMRYAYSSHWENRKLFSPTEALKQFVVLTRTSDIWDSEDPNFNKADDLAELFNQIGSDEYIGRMIYRIRKDGNFEFTAEDLNDIAKRRKLIEDACVKAYDTMRIVNVDGTKVAICDINYSFKNNFSQYLRDHSVQADIMAIADFNRGSMSYRTLSQSADCNAFAKKFGGGGNPAAAGSPITDELKGILGLTQPGE